MTAQRTLGRNCLWAAVLAMLLALAACGKSGNGKASGSTQAPVAVATQAPVSAGGSPSLLLVTIDTWRWDYIGVSGSGKVATPALDLLATEGVYEPECETPCPLTTPAHATIMTGLWPLHHRVLDCVSYSLPIGPPTLAEAFTEAGYRTSAFVSSQTLGRQRGLGRGFLLYEDSGLSRPSESYWDTALRDGADTTDAALRYLSNQPGTIPQMVWVHYYDLHLPYRPHATYSARNPEDAYAAEVLFVDDQVARLLDWLKKDAARDWRVIVVGDHGEGLGDHHETQHGLALYRSTLHVPFIIWPKPERFLAHSKPWRLEDLAPTIREWFNLQEQDRADGESLFNQSVGERILPSLTLQPAMEFSVNPCFGIRKGRMMYIKHGVQELYDLAADPSETRDLSGDGLYVRELEELKRICGDIFSAKEIQAVSKPTLAESAKEMEALKGLGYIGGAMPEISNLQRADIRVVCDDFARFERKRQAYMPGQDPAQIEDAYKEILSKYPRATLFQKDLGILLLKNGDLEGAFYAFDRAARSAPNDPSVLVNLGGLYLAQGRVEPAQRLFDAALVLDKDNAMAHKNLGIVFSQYLGDARKAVVHYKRYLELGGVADRRQIQEYIQNVEKHP